MFKTIFFPRRLITFVSTILLLALPALATSATYYVDAVNGNDANSGTAPGIGNAWKTITHAAATVPAGTSGAPNIIMVATGTYDVINTEAFPINFTHNYVSLTNDGSGLTTIDALGGFDALDVDAKGFSVSGFTFSNAIDAIEISEGGFTITNNIFAATVADGIYFYKNNSDLNTSVSFPDMSITGNTFNTTSNAIDMDVSQDFDYTTENLTVSFGNFTISGNTFSVTSNDGIDITDLLDIDDLLNGTITVGDFTVTNNTFTGGTTGFDFDSEIDEIDDCQVTIGNVNISNNTFTDNSSYAINLDFWPIEDVYGTSTVTLGDLTVSGNTIMATNYVALPFAYGIYIAEIDEKNQIYGESTVTTGSVNVTNNTVDVDGYGIYVYSDGIQNIGEEYWGDTASVTTGARTVSNNSVNSNSSDGIYIELEYIAEDMYGTAQVTYGNFNITNNTVTSDNEALYFYWYEPGSYMYEDSTATFGNVTISGNTLTSANSEAFYFDMEYCGYDMDDNAAITIGPTNISNNTFTTTNNAMGLYFYFYDTGYEMYGNSSLTISPLTIDNNTINATGNDGMYVEFDSNNNTDDLHNSAHGTLPDWIITNNTIDVTGVYTGIIFDIYEVPYDIYDNAVSHFGSILIDSNTFNPNKDAGFFDGVEIGFEDVLSYSYGATTSTYGDITITNNKFYNMSSRGVYVWYDEVGYDFTGASTLIMGDISIGMNTIDTAGVGIYAYLYDLQTEEGASVTIGDLDIYNNTLTKIANTGIVAYYYNENNAPDTASLTIGNTMVSGNTITGAPGIGGGIIFYVENSTDGITFKTPTINNNSVSDFNLGVYVRLLDQDDLSMTCNWIHNNINLGILFDTEATDISVSQNSIVGNTSGLTVNNGFTAVINAENNWWGDKLGPAACASCNGVNPGDMGTVDYTPWLTYEPQKSRCGVAFPWVMFTPATTGMGPAVP